MPAIAVGGLHRTKVQNPGWPGSASPGAGFWNAAGGGHHGMRIGGGLLTLIIIILLLVWIF